MNTSSNGHNFIRFVGTAGARFVTIHQLRSSGGVWISYNGTNILIDPGPGSLVRCLESTPKLDPALLDAIILTHRHIDHCNDVNIMIEAMTHGGYKKRGTVFLPEEMIQKESILLSYFRGLPESVVSFKEGGEYQVGAVTFQTPLKHIHSVETYGLKFQFGSQSVSFIIDTKYFEKIIDSYKADILIINTVFIESLDGIDHLSLKDAQKIITKLKPRRAVLTHFGRDIINGKPDELTKKLSRECGIEVLAAEDGMSLEL